MADAERELFLATLRHCGGNKRRTADVLGVSLKTVYNKLLGYGNGNGNGSNDASSNGTPLLRAASAA
jgi:DNA-binding NtrC family response regulator